MWARNLRPSACSAGNLLTSRKKSGNHLHRLIVVLFLVLWASLCLAQPPAAAPAPSEGEVWTEVGPGGFDTNALTERGTQILEIPEIDWKHAQTPHFVIHYEQASFARKVARMGEFFYTPNGYVTSAKRWSTVRGVFTPQPTPDPPSGISLRAVNLSFPNIKYEDGPVVPDIVAPQVSHFLQKSRASGVLHRVTRASFSA